MSWFSAAVKKVKKEVQGVYSGSDLETAVNTVTSPTGGVTSLHPDVLEQVQNAIQNVVPVQTTSTTGPSLAATQPTIGAGPEEQIRQTQLVPGMMQRGVAPGRMGRRQTMLTVGQSAAKIRARQTGY
tara:strand:+ start:1659 stop:2039 length:381 start_codon:yes stop_codon:yes gene_type:complete